MASSSSSPSSSSSSSSWTYDVFLSFRGEDTRHFFTSLLYNALRKSGIHVFMDDEGLERGEDISGSLLQAIERSRISLVILSPAYASSRWCLDELAKIMECQRSISQVAIPIFYKVDPADVRKQRGTYGKAMELHEQTLGSGSDRMLRWRKALTDIGHIAGLELHKQTWREALADIADISGAERKRERQDRRQYELIDNIVEQVLTRLDNIGQLFVAEHPVGVESRVHEVTAKWSQETSPKALIIGLWGMAGSGKTTIAKAVYNANCRKFKAKSFLANIAENSKHAIDQVNLQKQLISDITKTQVFKIPNTDRGKKIIRERVGSIKAFVVLDDVDSVNQLDALCGSIHESFCQGSVIIITSRDQHLLEVLNADHLYEMREMNDIESLELFSWHAFKQEAPFKNFKKLSVNVVEYCERLPLALEIIGSFLRKRTILEWDHAFSKLQSIPNKDIQAKLRIGYDGLDDYTEREIFLDICCFFIKKDRNFVTHVLDGCQLQAISGLQILIERSLVKVGRNNRLEMHNLLQEMGKEIIRESSRGDPEKRSRLWFREDVLDVLTKHTGTEAIEGISLEMETKPHRECVIDSKAFKKMRKLRLLRLDYVNLEGDYEHLSRGLRWLCWKGFPLKYTPKNLYQNKLVAIDFKRSNLIEVWKEPQLLEMLKTLKLSHSSNLKKTPDFTFLPNLETLVMKGCGSLTSIHESIGDLKNLLYLNLKGCVRLENLPRSIYKLKSLETFILSGCSLIDRLEEDFEQMESLTIIKLDNTAITTVPKSLARLERLKHGYISLPGFEGRAQDIFPSLILSCLSAHAIPKPQHLWSILFIDVIVRRDRGFCDLSPFLGDLVKLQGMRKELRSQFQLSGTMERILDALGETNMMGLESRHETPQISYMEASESCEDHEQVHIARRANSFGSLLLQMGVCDNAKWLKEKILQEWNNGGWDDSHLPGHQYPDWFVYYGEGCSVNFEVPQVSGCHLKAMLLNVVYPSCMNSTTPQFLIDFQLMNCTSNTVQNNVCWVTFHEDQQWQEIISSVQPGDVGKLIVTSSRPQFPVKKIVAYLVYEGY